MSDKHQHILEYLLLGFGSGGMIYTDIIHLDTYVSFFLHITSALSLLIWSVINFTKFIQHLKWKWAKAKTMFKRK